MVQWIMTGAVLVQERGYEWGWGMHPMSGVWGVWGIGMDVFHVVVLGPRSRRCCAWYSLAD